MTGVQTCALPISAATLTPPTFESDRGGNQFIVTMLFHHFLSPEDWDWLRQFSDSGLSDEEARSLVFVRETGAITNLAYRDLNHVDTLNASTHLRRLRDRELLEMRGKGAGTFYVPTAKLLSGWPTNGISRSDVAQSDNLTALSGNLGSLSGNPTDQSSNPVEKTDSRESLPPELAAQIAQLPKRVNNPSALQDLVERICAVKPCSVEVLSRHLGRDRQYILDSYVSPMVRAGRLAMTIPDQPNNPHQQYRTTTEVERAQQAASLATKQQITQTLEPGVGPPADS